MQRHGHTEDVQDRSGTAQGEMHKDIIVSLQAWRHQLIAIVWLSGKERGVFSYMISEIPNPLIPKIPKHLLLLSCLVGPFRLQCIDYEI